MIAQCARLSFNNATQYALIATEKWDWLTSLQFVANAEDFALWKLAFFVFKIRHRLILQEPFAFIIRNLPLLLRRLSITEIHFAGNLWLKK